MQSEEKELVGLVIKKKINRLHRILHDSRFSESADTNTRDMRKSGSKAGVESYIQLAETELETLTENLEGLNRYDAIACEECDGEIQYQRLLAIPHAQLCADCAVEAS